MFGVATLSMLLWAIMSYHEITPKHRAVYSIGGEMTGRIEMPHRDGHWRNVGWGIPLFMSSQSFYKAETYQEFLIVEDRDKTGCIESKSIDAETIRFCGIETVNRVEFRHDKYVQQQRLLLERRPAHVHNKTLLQSALLDFDAKWQSFQPTPSYQKDQTDKCVLMLMAHWGITYDEKLILSRVPKSIHEFCPSKRAKELVVSEYHSLDEVISKDLTLQLQKDGVDHCLHVLRMHIPPPTVRHELQTEWEKTNAEMAKKDTKTQEAVTSKIVKDKEARDALIAAHGKFDASKVDALRVAHDTTSKAGADHKAEMMRTESAAHSIESLSVARSAAVERESRAEALSLRERIQTGFKGNVKEFNDYERTRAIWQSNNTKVLTYGPSIPKFVAIGGD